jgi:hypothetical protein
MFGVAVTLALVLTQVIVADPPKSAIPQKPSVDQEKAALNQQTVDRKQLLKALSHAVSQLQTLMKPLEAYHDKESHQSLNAEDLAACKKVLHVAEMVSPEDAVKLRQQAEKRLRSLVEKYPNSPEAKDAKELLKGLDKKP